MRLTRDGELGCALGRDYSSGAKTVTGFRAALGCAWGCGLGGELGLAFGRAFATRRVARAEASRRGGPQLTLLWAP